MALQSLTTTIEITKPLYLNPIIKESKEIDSKSISLLNHLPWKITNLSINIWLLTDCKHFRRLSEFDFPQNYVQFQDYFWKIENNSSMFLLLAKHKSKKIQALLFDIRDPGALTLKTFFMNKWQTVSLREW